MQGISEIEALSVYPTYARGPYSYLRDLGSRSKRYSGTVGRWVSLDRRLPAWKWPCVGLLMAPHDVVTHDWVTPTCSGVILMCLGLGIRPLSSPYIWPGPMVIGVLFFTRKHSRPEHSLSTYPRLFTTLGLYR